MNDKLKDIRKGDTVEVVITAPVESIEDSRLRLSIIPDCVAVFYDREVASPHFSIKKVEKPLQAGDRVLYGALGYPAVVVATDGDLTWIRVENGKDLLCGPPERLVRA